MSNETGTTLKASMSSRNGAFEDLQNSMGSFLDICVAFVCCLLLLLLLRVEILLFFGTFIVTIRDFVAFPAVTFLNK